MFSASPPTCRNRSRVWARYAFRDLGWRHAVVVAENAEAGWGGAAAFLAEFCALGGRASQFPMSPDLQPPSVPEADGVAVFFTPFGTTPEALIAFAGGRLPLESSLLLGPAAWNDLNSLPAMPDELKRVVTVVPATTVGAQREVPGDRRPELSRPRPKPTPCNHLSCRTTTGWRS